MEQTDKVFRMDIDNPNFKAYKRHMEQYNARMILKPEVVFHFLPDMISGTTIDLMRKIDILAPEGRTLIGDRYFIWLDYESGYLYRSDQSGQAILAADCIMGGKVFEQNSLFRFDFDNPLNGPQHLPDYVMGHPLDHQHKQAFFDNGEITVPGKFALAHEDMYTRVILFTSRFDENGKPVDFVPVRKDECTIEFYMRMSGQIRPEKTETAKIKKDHGFSL